MAKISKGNSKIGEIPNVSMTPCASCNHDAPCRAKGQCYAIKALMYPAARSNWAENLDQAQTDRESYFTDITEYIKAKRPCFFRWHVAGDILDQDYLDCMRDVALEAPETKFLAFTKMHELDYSNVPDNLTIVFSMWPGWGNASKAMPRAWMQDGTETRIPSDAIECFGNCDNCGMCWHLPEIGKDVYFIKH